MHYGEKVWIFKHSNFSFLTSFSMGALPVVKVSKVAYTCFSYCGVYIQWYSKSIHACILCLWKLFLHDKDQKFQSLQRQQHDGGMFPSCICFSMENNCLFWRVQCVINGKWSMESLLSACVPNLWMDTASSLELYDSRVAGNSWIKAKKKKCSYSKSLEGPDVGKYNIINTFLHHLHV